MNTIFKSSPFFLNHVEVIKHKLKHVDNKNQIFIKYNFKITLKSDRSV